MLDITMVYRTIHKKTEQQQQGKGAPIVDFVFV